MEIREIIEKIAEEKKNAGGIKSVDLAGSRRI